MSIKESVEKDFHLHSNGIEKRLQVGICCHFSEETPKLCYLSAQEDQKPRHTEDKRRTVLHLTPQQALELGEWLVDWSQNPRQIKITYPEDGLHIQAQYEE